MSEKHRYDVGDYVLVPMRVENVTKAFLDDEVTYNLWPICDRAIGRFHYSRHYLTLPESGIYSFYVDKEAIEKFEKAAMEAIKKMEENEEEERDCF